MKNVSKSVQESSKTETYTANELERGILLLLKEFYVGDFVVDGDKIFIKFENGQRFELTIKESD